MRSKTWNLLLVDDDEDDYILTQAQLATVRPDKFNLEWAGTYEAGLAALSATHYDAVLVDYDLGPRTGLELIREIVQQEFSPPLILFTGRGSYEVDVEALDAGATLYLTKADANPLLLERSIRYAMERKQSETALRATNAALEKANRELKTELRLRKRAETAFTETTLRLQALFDSSPASIWEEDFTEVQQYFHILRQQGVTDFAAYFSAHPEAVEACSRLVRVIAVNQTSLDYFHVSRREELLVKLPRFFCDDSYPVFRDELVTLAEGRTKFACEIPICVDGDERRTIELHLAVMPGYEETLGRVLVSFFDVTERKRIEDELESLAQFPRDNPGPVLRLDAAGSVLYANPASAGLLDAWSSEAGEPSGEAVRRLVREALEHNRVCNLEQTVEGKTYFLTFAPFAEKGYVHVYGADITEQKAADEVIKRYAQELARSNRELEEFALVASHDLQEPVRKIQYFSNALQSTDLTLDDRQRDYLERMTSAADRMQRMIDDLLSLSRVTTQGRPFQPVDLGEAVEETLVDLENLLQATGGRVEVGRLPRIEADPRQMRQLFQNLIANGLKYHRPDVPPVISINYREVSPKTIQVYVTDNGIGFDENQIDQIFLPFKRLVGRSQYEGSGIGLAICSKIVERHSGVITARSVPGQGSTFFITLPVQPSGEPEYFNQGLLELG